MDAQHVNPSHPANQTQHTAKSICLLALASIMLGIYQWMELHAVSRGNVTPLCAISETINCAAVWNSPLSVAVTEITRIPMAGWGIVWGLTMLVLGTGLLLQEVRQRPPDVIIRALQLTSAIAAGVAILLLAYSVAIAVFCPTCLAFYLFVGVMTFMTTRIPGGSNASWLRASAISSAVLISVVALVLAFSITVMRDSTAADDVSTADAVALSRFLASQPPDLQQYLSNVLDEYRKTPPDNHPVDANRVTWGDVKAPVHVTEWIEIRCSHCRDLHRNLEQLTQLVPPHAWNIETRFFPLDSECNSGIQRSPKNGVSCLAAKLLICLAGQPQEAPVRAALFQNQPQLTTARIWELAGANGVAREKTEACIAAPETAKTLQNDIARAAQHRIDGTPLVVINGRKTVALPHLILALILSGGNADDPAFKALPPPQSGTTPSPAAP